MDGLAAVHRAFDELAGDVDRVVVAGLSMGGTLAVRLAEQRPGDLAGLVLVNPSLLTERLDAKRGDNESIPGGTGVQQRERGDHQQPAGNKNGETQSSHLLPG